MCLIAVVTGHRVLDTSLGSISLKANEFRFGGHVLVPDLSLRKFPD